MTNTDIPTKSQPDLKASLEVLLKLGTGLVGAGYFVVHLHFSQYGYYPSLSFSQYLVATVWVVLPLVAAWLFLSRAALPFLVKYLWAELWKSILAWLTLIIGFSVVCATVVGSLYFPEARWIASRDWPDRLIIMAVFSCFVIAIPLGLTAQAKAKQLEGVNRLSFLVNETSIGSLVFVAWLYFAGFSNYVYPEIPLALGGGKPQQIRLIVAPADKEELVAVGIRFSGDSNKSEPLKLLVKTSENYVILSASEQNVIEIANDLAHIVIYEPGKEKKNSTK
jgi:hypothetical protein